MFETIPLHVSRSRIYQEGYEVFGADDRSDSSNVPMKMFENDGAILVPMAVPCFCK
jgi:hypothetical protein